MKTDTNEPIYPEKDWANVPTFGLTKREYFAALAMQGLMANIDPVMANIDPVNHKDYIAENSVKIADALIKELNKE